MTCPSAGKYVPLPSIITLNLLVQGGGQGGFRNSQRSSSVDSRCVFPFKGHLSRFLAFGLGLSVTAIEGDGRLVDMATKFDRELVWALEKKQARRAKVNGAVGGGGGAPRLMPCADQWALHTRQWLNSNGAEGQPRG